MLQQDPSSQENLTTAQRRVTPEELSRAIASLEAKQAEEARLRDEEARRNAGTLSLHEAVDNLSLGFTEEQLWEEVQRQRVEVQADEPQPVIALDNLPRTRFPTQTEVFRPLIISVLLIVTAFLALGQFFPDPHQNVSPEVWSGPPRTAPPGLASDPRIYDYPTFNPRNGYPGQIRYGMPGRVLESYLAQTKGLYPHYRLYCVESAGIAYPPSLTMAMRYSQTVIPDGYSITSRIALDDFTGAEQTLNYSDVVFLSVYSPLLRSGFMSQLPARYIITTRYNGRLYLRCWVQRDEIAALKSGQACSLFTSTDTKDSPSQAELVGLTLPLELPIGGIITSRSALWSAVDSGNTGRGQSRVAIPNGVHILLDKHAWEKW
jgi:hypothetical protein